MSLGAWATAADHLALLAAARDAEELVGPDRARISASVLGALEAAGREYPWSELAQVCAAIEQSFRAGSEQSAYELTSTVHRVIAEPLPPEARAWPLRMQEDRR